MKVDIFCLCDFAQATEQGKLNLIGIFDSLGSEALPGIHGLFAIAIKLRFDAKDVGQKKFKMSILGPDKSPVAPDIESFISVPMPANLPASIHLVTMIPHLRLPQFGEYSIVLHIDGQQVASTPLYLSQITRSPSHPQPPPSTA